MYAIRSYYGCFSLFPAVHSLPQQHLPPPITIAFSTEPMPPYYTVSSDSLEISGLWRKMFDTLFIEKLGWQVHYLIRPWQRAQNEVKLGNAVITSYSIHYTKLYE